MKAGSLSLTLSQYDLNRTERSLLMEKMLLEVTSGKLTVLLRRLRMAVLGLLTVTTIISILPSLSRAGTQSDCIFTSLTCVKNCQSAHEIQTWELGIRYDGNLTALSDIGYMVFQCRLLSDSRRGIATHGWDGDGLYKRINTIRRFAPQDRKLWLPTSGNMLLNNMTNERRPFDVSSE